MNAVARRQAIAQAGRVVALVTTAWLFWMTLRPNPQVARQLSPLAAGAQACALPVALVINVLGNVVVFIPLGMGLAAAWEGRLAEATGMGAMISLFIEGMQSILPSRVSSLWDFVLNTVGVATGAFIVYLTFKKIWRHND